MLAKAMPTVDPLSLCHFRLLTLLDVHYICQPNTLPISFTILLRITRKNECAKRAIRRIQPLVEDLGQACQAGHLPPVDISEDSSHFRLGLLPSARGRLGFRW